MAAVIALACASCGDEPSRLAWGVGIRVFDARALGLTTATDDDPRFGAIVDTPRLALPTYDGSGQVVHPDVMIEPDRFIMAMTPYPYSDDTFENPSVLVSTDGMVFEDIGTNPLVPAPPYDHNDDPDIRIDPRTGEYEILYLETLRPERQILVSLRSRDLLSWTRRDAIDYDLLAGAPFIVSPSAIEYGGQTHLFFVETTTGQLQTMTSADGVTWVPATARRVNLEVGAMQPWHVDVFRSGDVFVMLISGFEIEFSQQHLYLATSSDLETWTLAPDRLLDYEDPTLDVYTLYRSTGIVAGDQLVVWYSMRYFE